MGDGTSMWRLVGGEEVWNVEQSEGGQGSGIEFFFKVDFILEMQEWLNIQKSNNKIHYINKHKGKKKDHFIRC